MKSRTATFPVGRRAGLPLAVAAAIGVTAGTSTPAAAAALSFAMAEHASHQVRGADVISVTLPSRDTQSPGKQYRIRPGDHLIGIAKAHGTTVDALREANGIRGSKIIAGHTLQIPGAPATEPATGARKPASGPVKAGSGYTIKRGDTLSGIAKAKDVTVDQLRRVNPHLTSNRILAGATIKLPSASESSSTGQAKHKVPSTFSGRKYSKDVVAAAQRNKDALVSRPAPSREQMRKTVHSTARKHGVDPRLALSISYQESGFNMRAVSPANAIGAMQVIPSSVDWAWAAGNQVDRVAAMPKTRAVVVKVRR